jgi:putative ABC transport system ATP-binding protein
MMETTMNMIEATNLRKTYRLSRKTSIDALRGVDVTIEAGEMVAIMGPSGSGKSTLMHLVGLLHSPDTDDGPTPELRIDGADASRLSDGDRTRIRARSMGFVFQSFNLVPTLTVGENITLPLLLARKRPDPVLLEAVVDQVRLGDCVTRRPWELSGGQQQRVALARALVSRPRIVFADEPAGNLGCRSGAELLWAFRQAVRELGQTVVMATRDPAVAAAADSVLFLSHGRLAGQMMHPTLAEILDQIGC